MIRNLLFHLYPKRKTFWRWHIEQLVKFLPVWNGKRIVVVVLDDHTEPYADVLRELEPLDALVFFKPNDASLGEVKYFIPTLSLLESLDPEEATFYAHGKGVTRDGEREVVRRWSKAMYDMNLAMPELIDRKLAVTPAVGAFRVRIPHSGAPWCFAGTFFWLQHAALFSRNWRDIENGRWGVEGYPGRHFKFEESFSTTPDIMPHREMPNWLYGLSGGAGATDGHVVKWMEWLRKEDECTRA